MTPSVSEYHVMPSSTLIFLENRPLFTHKTAVYRIQWRGAGTSDAKPSTSTTRQPDGANKPTRHRLISDDAVQSIIAAFK